MKNTGMCMVFVVGGGGGVDGYMRIKNLKLFKNYCKIILFHV